MKLIWSARSIRQLGSIAAFISADNPPAASKLVKAIKKSARLLKQNPFMGRRTEFEGVREWVVHPNYLLSYRVSSVAVEVAQVWHAAQQRYH
jgi:toxin ParE1/3/4